MKETTYDDLIKEVKTYIKDEKELKVIDDAYNFALKCHGTRKRKNGESYISHPINVAMILTNLNVDYITIASALMHETINHGGATKEEIDELFGNDIATIVSSISKLNRLSLSDDRESTALNLRKVVVGLAEDVRVLYIKLADRLHNMRTIWALEDNEIKEKINETKTVLIPIAARLGINSIKSELEDLCLRYSKPDIYDEILENLKNTSEELNEALEDMKEEISEILTEHGIKFKIKGRVKSVHSIYEKMVNGHKWSEIYDILALRIIVEKVDECYLAIGLIHAKYRPLPNRFKDYIAMPKNNMYQSLHTSVIGDNGKIYEVQVRTYQMDEVAEKGIASHWSYKEHSDGSVTNIMEEKLELFRNLIEQQDENNSEQDIENAINTEFLGTMIYCFTPKGDVIELPKNATPIDFAYRIHSRVGDTTVGAIVNNKIVPLDSKLEDGDIINIRTSSTATPSKEWLNFVITSQARSKIKSYFSKQDKEHYISYGKELLEKEIRRRKLSISEVLNNEHIKKLTTDLKLETIEDVYLSIGSLRYTPTFIINSIYEDKKDVSDILMKKVEKSKSNKIDHKSDIIVSGISDIKVSLANCCNPIPNDKIVGYITKGQGITVHRCDCINVRNVKERLINVDWNYLSDNTYLANLSVSVDKGNNKLLDIISIFSSKNIYVDSINTKQDDMYTIYYLTVKISNSDELNKVLVSLNNLSYVNKAERMVS